jgi:post-segregation antitoxin (ccd killing protein)
MSRREVELSNEFLRSLFANTLNVSGTAETKIDHSADHTASAWQVMKNLPN